MTAATDRSRRIGAAWIAFAVVFVTTIYVVKIGRRMPDFEVYRTASIRALLAEPLYRQSDGHWQFKYLPAFAVVAAPIAVVPDPVARALWFSASVALLVVLLRTSAALVPDRRYSKGFLIGAAVVLLGKFYAHELELGQVNILMAALVTGAALAMTRGREGLAGVLVACAIVVKPYAVLLVPYLVARRRAASIATVVAVFAAALILPALVYGMDANNRLLGEWWGTVTTSTAPNLKDWNNISALSVFTRALGPGRLTPMLTIGTIGLLLATAAMVFLLRGRVAHPEGLEVSLLLTMMPIISPQGWDYVFVIATPAVMYLVNYRDGLPRVLRAVVVGALLVVAFSIFDLVGRRAYTVIMSWSVIPACYMIQIAGLAALRVRRVA
jgi:Glycosyltransferase family 87